MSVKFRSILFLAQLCVLCLGANTYSKKGYEYHAQIQGWLKLNRSPVEWLEARTNCHLEGAYMVSPWSDDFTAAVNTLQLSYDKKITDDEIHLYDIPLYSGVHITRTKTMITTTTTFVEALYTYTAGEPTVLMEPKYELESCCGVFYSNGSTGEVDCRRKLPYVCYAPGLVPTPESPCTSTPAPEPVCGERSLGYELNQQTRHCYKFHAHVTNWTEANTICKAEGARLAVPNSDEEMRVLTSIHARYPDTDILGTSWPNWISVGIYWESDEWRTVDGQALSQAGYAKWKQGWPTRMNNFPYVCMERDGELSNTYSVLYPFICEKEPRS